MKNALGIVALAIASILLASSVAYGQGFSGGASRERSPFSGITFERDRAHVLVDDQWYEWVAIDGVTYETILDEARRRAPGDAQKRISEDLVALLMGLGVEPGPVVRLTLRTLDDQRVLVLPDVPMIRENRMMVLLKRRADEALQEQASFDRMSRTVIDAKPVFDELIDVVRTHHAYADLKGLDLDTIANEEIDRIGTNPTLGQAVLAAQRFIARLGDGHASIDDWLEFAPDRRLTSAGEPSVTYAEAASIHRSMGTPSMLLTYE